MIHVDTSFLIRALVAGSVQDRRLREWLRAGEPLAMSTVAWAEFLCGPVAERDLELAAAVIGERVPFGDEHAVLAARLFNESGRRRGSMIDCMVGAVALRAGAQIATANASDFARLGKPGLDLA